MTQSLDLSTPATIHDAAAVESARRAARLDPYYVRRFQYAFYQLRRSAEESLTEMPPESARMFAERLAFHPLTLVEARESQDGSTKLLFRTRTNLLLESVILRSQLTSRISLCISSQVGCAANCGFCATALMPRVQNLTAAEIVDQVVQSNQRLVAENRRIRNLVFMGMGEPLHNEEQVFAAAELLFSQRHFNLSPRRIVMSTVGIPDGMIRWAKQFRRAPIALSLHSADQAKREKLIPLARRYSLESLRIALDEVYDIQRGPMMIEYLMIEGINDSTADAQQLVEYLNGLPVLINLIPFNPVTHAPELRSPEWAHIKAFSGQLRSAGFIVTIRRSLGRDISAACGQLAQSVEHPQQVIV